MYSFDIFINHLSVPGVARGTGNRKVNKINKIPASEELTFEWGEKYQRAKRSICQLLRALEENKAGDDDDGSIQTTQGGEDQTAPGPRGLRECKLPRPCSLALPPEVGDSPLTSSYNFHMRLWASSFS